MQKGHYQHAVCILVKDIKSKNSVVQGTNTRQLTPHRKEEELFFVPGTGMAGYQQSNNLLQHHQLWHYCSQAPNQECFICMYWQLPRPRVQPRYMAHKGSFLAHNFPHVDRGK
jgi:hypothetical protein